MPRRVALPGLHERQVGADAFLEHVLPAVERVVSLPSASLVPKRGAGVEAGDAGTAGAELLGERALRHELELELAGQHLALELLVLADVRGDDLLHLPALEQEAHAEIVDAGVVADDRQALHAAGHERGDEVLRDAAQAEPARRDPHPVEEQTVERVRGGGSDLG